MDADRQILARDLSHLKIRKREKVTLVDVSDSIERHGSNKEWNKLEIGSGKGVVAKFNHELSISLMVFSLRSKLWEMTITITRFFGFFPLSKNSFCVTSVEQLFG